MDFQRSPNVPNHTVGVYGGTPLSNGATQGSTGANNAFIATSAIITDGLDRDDHGAERGRCPDLRRHQRGEPGQQAGLGLLKQFVVTAATVTDGSGNSTSP